MAANPHQQGHESPFNAVAASYVTDTFRLVAETRRQAEQIAVSARDAVRNFYRDPADLAAFIERHQTPVYLISGLLPSLCLWALGFDPGYIAPSHDKRYQRLEQVLRVLGRLHPKALQALGQTGNKNKADCHFEHGVFVLTKPLFTVGYLSHQLHHWLAFRAGMKGYSERSQQLYKKFWVENNGMLGAEVYDMSVDDMIALKAAINRDMEALKFLQDIASEILLPARRAANLYTRGKANA